MLRSRWGRTSRKLRNCILISVNRILYSKWLSMPFRQMKICLQNTILKRGSVLIRFWGPDGLEAQSCPQLEWLCSYCFFFCPILDSARLIWSLCAITLLLTCWRRLPSIIETFDSDIFGLVAGCKFLSVQVFNHYLLTQYIVEAQWCVLNPRWYPMLDYLSSDTLFVSSTNYIQIMRRHAVYFNITINKLGWIPSDPLQSII